MKIGLISDVHADLAGLNKVVGQLRALGVDRILCAGDVVGYGPQPAETVARLKELKIRAVRGNHDRWAIERGAAMIDPYGVGPLSHVTLETLRCLPPVRFVPVEGALIVVTHGTPGNDMEYLTRQRFKEEELIAMLDDLAADVLVVGHTHEPMWFRCNRGTIINPGAIYSAPSRLRSSRSFCVLELPGRDVTFYDVDTGAILPVSPWEGDD